MPLNVIAHLRDFMVQTGLVSITIPHHGGPNDELILEVFLIEVV